LQLLKYLYITILLLTYLEKKSVKLVTETRSFRRRDRRLSFGDVTLRSKICEVVMVIVDVHDLMS